MFHQSDKYPANSLSFYLAVVLSRQYISRIRSFPRGFLPLPLKIHVHRLLYGLQGSLIPFAPHTFVVQCQSLGPSLSLFQKSTFVTGVLIQILPFHWSLYNSHFLSHTLVISSLVFFLSSEGVPLCLPITTYQPFMPNPYEQHSLPLYDRICWHNH